ncbi:hypothetical protein BX600DRAFT_428640 [Xylariales sp. PMI_506]|nr:hypothetical protein BX600DRAFT_428640 [Xylariales sp. PMI_506]
MADVKPNITNWQELLDARDRYFDGTSDFDPTIGPRHPILATRQINAHDGSPCTIVWHQYTRDLEGQPTETFGNGKTVPFASWQIYVPYTEVLGNTPQDIAQRIAIYLESQSFDLRHGEDIALRDRLNVYCLKVSHGLNRDQLINTCIEHQKSEIITRANGRTTEELKKSELYLSQFNYI